MMDRIGRAIGIRFWQKNEAAPLRSRLVVSESGEQTDNRPTAATVVTPPLFHTPKTKTAPKFGAVLLSYLDSNQE